VIGEEKQEDDQRASLQVNNNGREVEGGQTSNPSQENKSVSSLADLVETYEHLKAHTPSMAEMQKVIETGISGLPQIQDAEKPYYYAPRNPYPTSSHYPQQPMAFEKRPAIWSEIEVEVLFYLFYYHQGGYLQLSFNLH
jgi:CCR4-NOT transcription complex subunit 3